MIYYDTITQNNTIYKNITILSKLSLIFITSIMVISYRVLTDKLCIYYVYQIMRRFKRRDGKFGIQTGSD